MPNAVKLVKCPFKVYLAHARSREVQLNHTDQTLDGEKRQK